MNESEFKTEQKMFQNKQIKTNDELEVATEEKTAIKAR